MGVLAQEPQASPKCLGGTCIPPALLQFPSPHCSFYPELGSWLLEPCECKCLKMLQHGGGSHQERGHWPVLFTLETPWESQPSDSSAPAAQTQRALSSMFGHRAHPGLPNLPPAHARCSSVPHMFQRHEFSVDMTCEGCSNAVTRVLNKLGGELLAHPYMPRTRPQQLRMRMPSGRTGGLVPGRLGCSWHPEMRPQKNTTIICHSSLKSCSVWWLSQDRGPQGEGQAGGW